eukprot:3034807-Rhodomonas_salina.1
MYCKEVSCTGFLVQGKLCGKGGFLHWVLDSSSQELTWLTTPSSPVERNTCAEAGSTASLCARLGGGGGGGGGEEGRRWEGRGGERVGA